MIYKYETIDSTNLEAKRNIEKYNSFDVLVSKRQTNGYGRRGTAWVDSEGLFFTMILKKYNADLIHELPFICANCVHQLLLNNKINSLIKWPNDIIVNNKKICGILVENNSDFILIGIGININPVDLAFATSLREEHCNISFDNLADELARLLVNTISKYNFKTILDNINSNFYLSGKEIQYNNNTYVVLSMNIDGSLRVRSIDGNIISINSADITLTNSYK